ncbi:MAG: prolyl oligopeptidase family serine peptidase [Bacteroidota bacterium]
MKRLICLFTLTLFMTLSALAQKPVLTAEKLRELDRLGGAQVSPDGESVLFTLTSYDAEENASTRDVYVMPVAGGEPQKLNREDYKPSNVLWRPDGKKIGFLSSKDGSVQLWEMNPNGSRPAKISDIEGGVSGFKYSPDMQHVFFVKEVKVEKSPHDMHPDLPKSNALIYDDLMYRHWDSWHNYSYSHIFLATYNNGKIGSAKDIMEGEPYDSPLKPFGGIGQINFTPDGKSLAYTCKKLKGKEYAESTNSDIYLYNIETGNTQNLTDFNEGYDKYPVFSPDGKYMAWESMETPGFEADKNRIMIMDMQTGTYSDFSEGFDQSSSGFQWSSNSKKLYFVSGHHATYQMYSLDIGNSEITQITQGQHNYNSVMVAGDHLLGAKMSMRSPVELFRIDPSNGSETQITAVNKEILESIELANVEERWIKTTDGKDMLVWVIYPPHFDENKKYPALLYCGGGPQSAVSQFFSYRWNFQMMAAHDYVVIAPNRRGLPTFGQEWNDQISQDYGGQNMQDLLTAARTVSQEPFIDEDRLGAVGASYGGFSVFWLAGNHDGLFKSFIAHCGMFNFESWYGTTEEMFFANQDLGGAYWEYPQPPSYDFSPHLFVQNWDTPIMVIHGAKDFRVPVSEGMQAFNAAQMQNVPSRFLVFPEENHWVLSAQNGILWQREFFEWLDEWLKDE